MVTGPESRKTKPRWRRTPIDPALLRDVSIKDDRAALVQAVGHLVLFFGLAAASIFAATFGGWAAAPVFLLHGVVAAFLTNGIHELSHDTVFKSSAVNRVFLNVFCFLRWINPHAFWRSHTQHHRHTLFPPKDLEVVLPMRFTLLEFLGKAIVDPLGMASRMRLQAEYSFGVVRSEWDRRLFDRRDSRDVLARWSRAALLGHGLILLAAWRLDSWALFVAVSLTPAYGGGLFFLCNNTQHAGLVDRVYDYRLSCRTMRMHPILERLYWNMNFHTEHHMYPAVPFYNLPRLHRLVQHDLPVTVYGLASVWREILEVQERQRADPTYQRPRALPPDNRQET